MISVAFSVVAVFFSELMHFSAILAVFNAIKNYINILISTTALLISLAQSSHQYEIQPNDMYLAGFPQWIQTSSESFSYLDTQASTCFPPPE